MSNENQLGIIILFCKGLKSFNDRFNISWSIYFTRIEKRDTLLLSLDFFRLNNFRLRRGENNICETLIRA